MKLIYIPLLFLTIILTGCNDSNTSNSDNINASDDVIYELTFKSDWNATNFPTNYPTAAHFSGLIGLTHNDQVSLFKRSELATPGVIVVAETGAKGTLANEINTYITNNDADKIVDGGGIPTGSNSVSLSFSANTNYSYFSIVSMVAPSPDWFIGIDSLKLYENGQWKDNLTLDLRVYDAGSDSADTFTAANAPETNNGVITRLTTDATDTNFFDGIHRDNGIFIGTITLKLKP